MSTISKFAGRVVCTKEQFNALAEKDPNKEYLVIDDDTYAELTENNRFTGLNTFTESTQFDKGIESDGNVAVSNSVVKIMNNSDNGDGTNKDYVAQYDADGISLEENGNKHTVKFPNSDGTFALIEDINKKIGFKYSELKNNDIIDNGVLQKDDVWYTEDADATIGLTHKDQTNQSTVGVSKAFVEVGVRETIQNGSSAQITVTSDTITLNSSRDGDKYSNIIITPDGATLNAKTIVTEDLLNLKTEQIPEAVTLTDPDTATNGNLTQEQLLKLQSNKANYIIFANKKYELKTERIQGDSMSYGYNDYLNNRCIQEVITITISTLSWVLNSCTLISNKDYANGVAGAVSIKQDFSDGLEIATADGNLSIYGALETDIAGRNSKRPITATNLNKAVLAALTDNNKVTPSEEQKTTFKTAWGISDNTNVLDAEMSDESTNAVQNKTLKAELDNCVKCSKNVQSGQVKVYCATQNNPNDTCLISNSGTGNAITRYTASGQVVVNKDPSGDYEVTNKKYVDGAVPKYGVSLPDPTNAAYKVGCSFLNTATGGLYVLVSSGDANNRSWQLQTTIEKPQWRNILPHINDTQEVDKTKVLFTKVAITTTDSTNFPGMNGKSLTIQGFTDDGFSSGTIVCDEVGDDIKYSPCFIGSITSTRASGILVKGTNSIAVVNVNNPEVSFTYEYLW